MKELSIEEKAKAYDEAIEVAKRKLCFDNAGMIDNFTPDDIREIFPELKESEDESNDIIKCLINGMRFYYEDNEEATWGTEKFSMKVKDILSWLEKQNLIMAKSPQLGEQKQEENKRNLGGISSNWSEEDEQHIDSLSKRLDGLCRSKFEWTRFSISEDIKWLKSLKSRVVRKDVFIEKACEWLRTHSEYDYLELIKPYNYCGACNLNKKKMIEDFKKYIKEE